MSHENTDLQDGLQDDQQGGAQAASSAPETGHKQTEAQTQPDPGDSGAVGSGEQPQAGTATGEEEATEQQTNAELIATLREALQSVTDEAQDYRDQALRAAAEAENTRKRAQRDVEAARKYALEKFAAELLGVRDSLEMGLKAGEDSDADRSKLVEGMELTSRMLASAMEKFGVEVINPEGETFNPELHEAVSMHETDDQAPNTVVSVMQKGYTLNGRVLRAAMVVVARAPSGG